MRYRMLSILLFLSTSGLFSKHIICTIIFQKLETLKLSYTNKILSDLLEK